MTNKNKLTKIKFHTYEQVKEFNETASSLESDILIHSGRFAIDGKSIMGIFSLDLSKELLVEVSEKKQNEENILIEKMKKIGIII